jgi:hypothetical protein
MFYQQRNIYLKYIIPSCPNKYIQNIPIGVGRQKFYFWQGFKSSGLRQKYRVGGLLETQDYFNLAQVFQNSSLVDSQTFWNACPS